MPDDARIGRHCRFCGAVQRASLGECSVCHLPVCARCGNTQHRGREKIVAHDTCLKRLDDDDFSMIKIVKE